MKLQRQAAILRVVRGRRIGSQDELRRALARDGFRVTQATLSRDVRELKLAKVSDARGSHPNTSGGSSTVPTFFFFRSMISTVGIT